MAFGRLRGTNSRARAEINMVPLIDVMLVLLVIFILTAPLVTQSVKLKLPEAVDIKEQVKQDQTENQPIIIAINEQSEVHINETLMPNDETVLTTLENLKAEATANNPEHNPLVQLHVDVKVPYEVVAKTITALSKAGLGNIGFVTLPDEGGAKAAEVTP
ncbi:biopolymer transporter ExbD [Wohlfahrtiimonas sp. G9077]|uniref:ExbD/TolR family protein n=1 Tax=Wohlfahrtiimonas sp. G9077 TaxID=1980118 RepID=UPI000B97EBD3|nr:biopolymer transporter ExbD [Wohlfahrtiimonas sp. G9077]OYQ72961.1 biopolymer transporter ExbD [Wohlfahrtiimonas sp. G9077]